MCGIAGKLSNDAAQPVDGPLVRRMTDVLRHRGPDAGGIWVDGHVGLGSRRLAIIDLSPQGHQPMCNEDGSLWIVFNGEIYNFLELREELTAKGHAFRSQSDTETVLHLYEEAGPDCVTRLWGMFAFALWDGGRQRLFAARDRLGKKPLYYQQDDRAFRFGSEPKAILQDLEVPAEADPEAIHHFLTYGFVPSPWSAFRGIRKLPPAHYLLAGNGRVSLHRYWTLSYVPKRTEREEALGEEFLALFEDAVRRRLISDVPLGALLSGGIDSSVVVATMRRLTAGAVRTFSIGFDRPEYDELAHARTVARHFATDHHELVVKPDAVTMLPRLVWHYNEPFADSSALPSMALCEMARGSVTVALNGDGGDEAFAGYDRYLATRLAGMYDRLPAPARWALRRGLGLLPRGTPKSPAYRARRLGEVLAMEPHRRYARWLTCFDEERKAELCTPDFAATLQGPDSLELLLNAQRRASASNSVEAAVEADVGLYLPDDLLVKMDIASMAQSLEVRSPFLDHRVVEFAASLPLHLKLRGLTQKYLLKRAMKDRLPAAILRRTKMGFGVPIDHWFRDELRDMAHDVLLGERARQRGYFRPDVARRYLDEHASGQAHHHFRLWTLLMLELWHRTFIDQRCPAAPPLQF